MSTLVFLNCCSFECSLPSCCIFGLVYNLVSNCSRQSQGLFNITAFLSFHYWRCLPIFAAFISGTLHRYTQSCPCYSAINVRVLDRKVTKLFLMYCATNVNILGPLVYCRVGKHSVMYLMYSKNIIHLFSKCYFLSCSFCPNHFLVIFVCLSAWPSLAICRSNPSI